MNNKSLDIFQFNKKIGELKRQYKMMGKPVLFDFRKFCASWKWAKRSDVFTHNIHKYPARLLPYIPIFFLSSRVCNKDEIVLDPFAGSGTVLLESIIHPYFKRNCIGIEINPLARLIAKVKTTSLDENELRIIKERLFLKLKEKNINGIIPEYKNLSIWFSRNAQNKLGKLRACIEKLKDDDYKDFFLVCFSSIIRKASLADPYIPPPVVLKISKYNKKTDRHEEMKKLIERNKNPPVRKLFEEAVEQNTTRIKKLSEVVKKGKAKIVWDDSRVLKMGKMLTTGVIDKNRAKIFKDNSVGLIITSPPYITAQKYVRTTKLELLWLGLINLVSLAELDKNTIGTERVKLREMIEPIDIKPIDILVNKISRISTERAVMTNKYFHDMLKVIQEGHRVLKKSRRMILIVGDNEICGRNVKTHELLAEIGRYVGFKQELIIKDRIRSRGMITSRHKSGGLIQNEFVIILKK